MQRQGEAVWHLTARASIYVTEDPERACSGLFTIAVSDLDAQLNDHAGPSMDQVVTEPGAIRKLIVTDPDGNKLTSLGTDLFFPA